MMSKTRQNVYQVQLHHQKSAVEEAGCCRTSGGRERRARAWAMSRCSAGTITRLRVYRVAVSMLRKDAAIRGKALSQSSNVMRPKAAEVSYFKDELLS